MQLVDDILYKKEKIFIRLHLTDFELYFFKLITALKKLIIFNLKYMTINDRFTRLLLQKRQALHSIKISLLLKITINNLTIQLNYFFHMIIMIIHI